jgi:hypothetical protein
MATNINSASIGPFSIVTPSAKETVLIANTPSFLLDRLRKDIAVQTVVDNMTGTEIIAALRNTLSHPPADVIEIVLAYIYLVALSSSDPQDFGLWREIAAVNLSRLEWGDAIRTLITIESIPTTTLNFSACKKPHP